MKTWPLQSLTMEQAQHKQFQLVDIICRHFPGSDFLNAGDLGLVPGLNQPQMTHRVESVLADFFGTSAAVMVQGAGTGAIRSGLAVLLKAGGRLLIHDAPLYPTTAAIAEQMGLQLIRADFNQLDKVKKVIENHRPQAALIQHTRQKMDDSYGLQEVIACFNQYGLASLTDDNYAVMKVDKIGCECGATLATFSCFKLFGPPGIGVVVGDDKAVKAVRQSMYSGGSQIQGFQAMDALRGLVFAPVMHAVQAQVNDSLVKQLSTGSIPLVKQAFIANAQSKVLLVEFHQPIAEKVLAKAQRLGALPYPVGAESRYEIPPLFYRVSGTFRQSDPTLEQRMIRINPNRSGAQTVLRILRESCEGL
ncbi:aminotransferase class V-fold PLP-dependent enzyme [Buttiauxella warmboldiae]|uniref:Aminotransferase class V-fold PLP-dependent enzyme n=1 Tax=Buttiauxella warmboldiae TaxID=82993 RepID=A0A3N5DSU7_9ENTR|nr:aminotransferase class V-fold PLP-dependent enzyme [Buttiauxella warmboldiae]RPH28750.1 aminotransferase class V-fold PLP-dependent enzyme [Buttiauxella warmboldiae]